MTESRSQHLCITTYCCCHMVLQQRRVLAIDETCMKVCGN